MRFLAVSIAVSILYVGAAAAQPAPIVYAGQGAPTQTASLGERLNGGADNSYGYGRDRQRGAASIDMRRPSGASAVAPAAAPAATARLAAQERPTWLEQERVGPPYQANGSWYVPTAEPGYEQEGLASWYGPDFHGAAAANGDRYDQEAMTAAHPTLPLNSLVQVTNLQNGREVIVRITDRGPFVGERLIDLSRGAANVLGFERNGTTRVHVRYLGPAPRRVNASGAPSPIPAPSPTPMQAAQNEPMREGPISLAPAGADPWADPAPQPAAPLLQPAAYTPAPAAAPAGAYMVQVGAFADLTNAHRVRALAQSAGPVSVDSRQTAAGELFRVRVGPFASREEAQAAQRSLAGLGYPEAVIARP